MPDPAPAGQGPQIVVFSIINIIRDPAPAGQGPQIVVFQIKNVLEEPGPAPAGQGPQFVVVLIANAIENDRIRFRPANDKCEHATLHRHTTD